MILALLLLRFASGSFLAAMGDACGGIFEAGHGFLAESNWNYLLATVVAAVFISQAAFFFGGGFRLLKVTHREKKRRHGAGFSCPALANLSGRKWASHVCVLPADDRLEAQTVGLLNPRILVTKGLVDALDSSELDAVLAHEEAHRASRDNVMIVIAKSVALTLFYLPGPRQAYREMRAGLERAADVRAADSAGGRLAVAGALARIAVVSASEDSMGSTSASPAMSAAVTGNGSDLASRLESLMDEKWPSGHVLRHLVLFSVGMATIIAIFVSSALAVAGSDQRQAFICFTQHEQSAGSDGICIQDHPDHLQ